MKYLHWINRQKRSSSKNEEGGERRGKREGAERVKLVSDVKGGWQRGETERRRGGEEEKEGEY